MPSFRALSRPWRLLPLAISLWATLPAQSQPAVLADTLAARVSPCTQCHGREGRAAADGYHPRIAGKPAGYLFHQLLNFRDGRRHYGPMVQMTTLLPDAYLLEMAEHFAALDLPYPPPPRTPTEPALLVRGEQLALRGDAAHQLPACTTCHGPALTGVLPATPGLLGLPRDYLAGQLGAWVTGQRRAHAPDCMAEVARRLQGQDVAAVSAWLAAQPVPLNAKAVAKLAATAPLRCGSAVGHATGNAP
jgi:cytochrome c553